jgi:uncharacterized protein (DUF433 family)
MASLELLERPIYSLAQVDRLLALHPGTARRWLEGYERRGRTYPPVVRDRPTGEETVTWGEFVETRFLAEFRNQGVPVTRMRPAIERLREAFGTRYPLATARPFAAGRELVLRVQETVGLDSALRLVVVRSGQYLLSDPAEQFWRALEFDDPVDGMVVRLHPMKNADPVVLDPLRQFGEPVVRSVPTAVLAEEFDAGDSVDDIADTYDLTREEVEAALRYEKERVKAQAFSAA